MVLTTCTAMAIPCGDRRKSGFHVRPVTLERCSAAAEVLIFRRFKIELDTQRK